MVINGRNNLHDGVFRVFVESAASEVRFVRSLPLSRIGLAFQFALARCSKSNNTQRSKVQNVQMAFVVTSFIDQQTNIIEI